MPGQGRIPIVVMVLLAAAGCASSTPSLPPAQAPEPPKQAGTASAEGSREAADAISVVAGNPMDIYALVARGAHRCWFGADGALRPTHVFHAEAEPPAKGGAAEIVLHERDETLRDKRGARAFRITISAIPAGVRVGVDGLKMDEQVVQLMTKDVMSWAKGGGECSLPRQAPSPASAPAKREVKPVRAR